MKKMGSVIPAAIYVTVTTLVLYLFFSHWTYDDPFITYRYAANLQKGLGFVYNQNERVLSTTTPLFTILLALLGNLWPDLPQLANFIGAIGLAMGGLFLWDLAHTWRSPLIGWCGLLFYPTFPLLVSTLGSEIPLYLAFCLGAFASYTRGRHLLTTFLVALATLTRPDGILLGITLAIHYILLERRRYSLEVMAVFLGMTLPWVFFAWAYFGTSLPVTLAAKQQQGIMEISQQFIPGFLDIFRYYSWQPYLLAAGLAIVGIFMFRRARHWALLLAWTTLYFLAYSALGVSGYFWYYAPLVPGFIVLLGLGISVIKEYFALEQTSFRRIVTTMLFLGLVSAQTYQLWQLQQHRIYGLYMENLMDMYTVVGEWLYDNTPPQATVGTLEVGIIGYYSQRPMIDFAGLIQPEVSDQFARYTSYEDSALWAVERYRPDYLVLYEKQFPQLEEGYVNQHCEIVQKFLGNSYDNPISMVVYSCRK